MKEIAATISEDLHKYLAFLEKSRLVKSKEEALSTALEFYKRLAMHDWLPYTYRMGGGRVFLMDSLMLADLFHGLSNREIYSAAKATALKRKLINPFFRDLDLSDQHNWPVVLNELEIMGWGRFSRFPGEIKVEFCALPIPYLQGYFEGMFGLKFERHQSKIPGMNIFVAKKKRTKGLGKF